jgi:hypothetical protein
MKLEIAHMRFWGKGSNFALLKEAMDMKDEFEGCTTKEGCPGPRPIEKRQRFWEISSVSFFCFCNSSHETKYIDLFWTC